MNYWIDITDANETRYGDGPITTAIEWESIERLDAAGTFRFKMPASDPRSAIVQPKRIARCYTKVQGTITEIGSGIIDKIVPSVDALKVVTLEISGDNMLRELTYRSVGYLTLSDSLGNGVTDAVDQIIAMAPTGWSIDGSVGTQEPEGNVYGAFAGETVLNALVKITQRKGEHFRQQSGRKIAWIGKTLSASGVRAIQGGDPITIDGNKEACIIQSLEEIQDTYSVCTRLYPYGAGVGDARLTLAACDRSVPAGFALDKIHNCLINANAEAVYGRIDKYLAFKEIAPISNTDLDMQSAANVLYDTALIYLVQHAKAERFYNISVAKVDKQVRVGETLRVVFTRIIDGFNEFSINDDLVILETTTKINSKGICLTDLKVATIDRWPENDMAAIVSQMDEGRSMESHPQLNANAYVVSYREPMDNSHPAQMDFWLGSEVVNVVQVALRFRIDPLRSTVKSVSSQSSTSSSGGGGTNTSSNGGGGGVTSSSGGASSVTSSSISVETYDAGGHLHTVAGGWTNYVDDHFHTVESHTHGVTVPAHTHGVSYGTHSHTVSIGTHSHTLTPDVDLVYGIFEGGTPLTEAQLIYKVNGGTEIGRATSIGGGWYELDLTSKVTNGLNSRPIRKDNCIVISTMTANYATITGQLVVRTTIQAIAVL